MKVTIEIPKEFEAEFVKNKFSETFNRIISDIDYHFLSTDDTFLSGNYEMETIEMLKKAFENTKKMPRICCGTCRFYTGEHCINPFSPYCSKNMPALFENCRKHWMEAK